MERFFFLGMDYPEGARVVNAAINLGVYGRDASPRPPVEAYLRVIDRPSFDWSARTCKLKQRLQKSMTSSISPKTIWDY